MESPADRYLREHSSRQSEALDWIEKQTNIHTNYPRMLSGAVQGRLLTMLVEISQAKRILEIGAFTGYYYASSMLAQTITPIALGSLMLLPDIDFAYLPVYASINLFLALAVFSFVKNIRHENIKVAKGLEVFDQED